MAGLFTFSVAIYLVLYALEGVVRYGLYNVGADSAILVRDGLIIGPLALLAMAQAFRLRIHPAYVAFAAIVSLHGAIAYFNFGQTVPAIYGAKLLVNILFGFFIAGRLTMARGTLLRLLFLLWIVSIVGVVLDKYVYTFPWMGLEAHIGGISVDVSRGWDIDSGPDKRAAGFTRSSIAAAMLIGTLASLLAPRLKNFIVRVAFLAISVVAVFLTTQKGALSAIMVVAAILCTPSWARYRLLCLACLALALVDIALPIMTNGLQVSVNGGVFSLASFGMRIALTWPDAWSWIFNHDTFPFGVGLGGIGGAQRFYAPNFFNPSDNMFVFLYANFGLMSLFYMGWAVWVGQGLPLWLQRSAVPALAVLAFMLGYGAALSMLEDQLSLLFFGVAAGALWQLRQRAWMGRWRDPFNGEPAAMPAPALAPDWQPARAITR